MKRRSAARRRQYTLVSGDELEPSIDDTFCSRDLELNDRDDVVRRSADLRGGGDGRLVAAFAARRRGRRRRSRVAALGTILADARVHTLDCTVAKLLASLHSTFRHRRVTGVVCRVQRSRGRRRRRRGGRRERVAAAHDFLERERRSARAPR